MKKTMITISRHQFLSALESHLANYRKSEEKINQVVQQMIDEKFPHVSFPIQTSLNVSKSKTPAMIKVEITHQIHPEQKKVLSSTRKIKIFGIMIYQQVHHYPDAEEYTVFGY